MTNKTLSLTPLIHPTADVRSSRLGAYTEVGARTRLLEVALGDYSYIVNDSEVAYTTFGKFCSVAAVARINPGNHPMSRATQSHVTYRGALISRASGMRRTFSPGGARIWSSSAMTCGSGTAPLSFPGAPSGPARWSAPAPW
jgi:acetyltransferase-like isoleucine patch superfamily enzyme